MAHVPFSDRLRSEYQFLFDQCQIVPARAAEVDGLVRSLERNAPRYASVAGAFGMPWQVVAVIHNMECSQRFDLHLHNGDPLTARTRRVPPGRPKTGEPPFSWEESAIDALSLKRMGEWGDWSVPGILYQLEGYNGWGYRLYHPETLSPYLWSFSNHYTSGKYVGDGVWSDTAVSKQCGAATLLRRMAERGLFDAAPHIPHPVVAKAAAAEEPMLRYSKRVIPGAIELQRFLNQFPDIYLKEDGKPGDRTSEAFFKLTGHYLKGDPRA